MAFNPINWLLGLFSLDIAIDLGTANTLVHVRGKGIVINEPSWVTVDKKLRQPVAIGLEAKEMVGRTPSNVMVVRPIRDGVIAEFDVTQVMLEYFIGKVHEQSMVPLPRPRVIVGLPTGVTEVEKRAVYDAVMASGARQAMLIEEPIAAALGAGLPVGEIRGSMVVDIGGGTTEVAVLSMSGVVASRSWRACWTTGIAFRPGANRPGGPRPYQNAACVRESHSSLEARSPSRRSGGKKRCASSGVTWAVSAAASVSITTSFVSQLVAYRRTPSPGCSATPTTPLARSISELRCVWAVVSTSETSFEVKFAAAT